MDCNKNRLIKNVYSLIKQRGLKIGEVEAKVGVSSGYLSKMLKSETDSLPGLDIVIKLAEILEVSIDMLINGDFGHSNDNYFYICKFSHQLENDTNLHKLEWKMLSELEFFKYEIGREEHPLFKKRVNEIDSISEEKLTPFIYHSLFTNDRLVPTGNSYETFSVDMGHLFFMCLRKIEPGNVIVKKKILEMYAVTHDEGELVPICSSCINDCILESVMFDLYECIESHEKDIKINSKAKDLMAAYLSNNLDELPFQ